MIHLEITYNDGHIGEIVCDSYLFFGHKLSYVLDKEITHLREEIKSIKEI